MTTKNPVGRPTKPKPREDKAAFITLTVNPGESIGEVCRRAVREAGYKHCLVRFTFQGVDLEATEDVDPWDLGNIWFRSQKKGAA